MSVNGAHPMAAVTRDHRIGSFWHSLHDHERLAVARVSQIKRYAKGTTIIRATERDRWAAVLYEGHVRVVAADGARDLAHRWPGDIVGEQALIDKRKRSASVIAATPVLALVLSSQAIEPLLERHPRVMRVLCAVVSERLREADRTLTGHGDDSFTKIVQLLVGYASKHGVAGERGILIRIGAQADIADQLGLSRESVVRALTRLRTELIVSTSRGMIIIHDLDRLAASLTCNE